MICIPEIPHIYAVFILLSFIIPFLIIYLRNRKEYKGEILFYSFLTAFICSMLGGLIYHRIADGQWGLSSYGGAIGLIASVFVYNLILRSEKDINITKAQRIKLKDEFLLHIPLIYSISKMACGMGGCCYGFMYIGPLCVSYNKTDSYFPIQFIEVITFLLIYLAGIFLLKHNKYRVLVTFIVCAHSKAILECFRNGYDGINSNQVVSFIFMVICLAIILIKEWKEEKANGEKRDKETSENTGRLHV